MITHSHPHFNACCSFADWVSRASMLMYVMRANQRAPSSKSNFWWTRERWWRWRPTIRSTSGPFKRRFRPSCIVWSFKEKGKSLKRLGGHAPGLVMRKLISPFFSSFLFINFSRRLLSHVQHHIHSSSGGQQMALCGHRKGQHSHRSHGVVYVKWLHHPLE